MSRRSSNVCRSFRPAFTLIEVLMASFILFLFPAAALFITLRLERFARGQVEKMAAAAVCEDIYNRCLRELGEEELENFKPVSDADLTKSDFEQPVIYYKDGSKVNPLQRDLNFPPLYSIELTNDAQGNPNFRVTLKWGTGNKSTYNTDEIEKDKVD